MKKWCQRRKKSTFENSGACRKCEKKSAQFFSTLYIFFLFDLLGVSIEGVRMEVG